MQAILRRIQTQMKHYAEEFLRVEYGSEAVKVIGSIEIIAVDAYDAGGVSEATGDHIKIAAKRDVEAGKLTSTTKLILRHELGHIFDPQSEEFGGFHEEMQHERTAWKNAKPKNAAENWYKNLSIRTHIDPLKMQSKGFPRPETKLSSDQLQYGTAAEIARLKKFNPLVDKVLAMRYAMANLVENPTFYSQTKI